MSRVKPPNPFPAEAVATYPALIPSCESFSYMNEIRDLLSDYLTNYELDDKRYGGAFGIVGAHGSGKTHVLNWIRESVPELKSSAAFVTYGKADNGVFFNLYRQLLADVGKARLNELFDAATRRAAKEQVLSAHATASVASRIESGALEPLYRQGNLDQVKVENSVASRLYETQVPAAMIRTLLSVPNAGYGKSAYAWLMGEPISQTDLSALGLVRLLQPAADTAPDSAVNTDALDALEAVAALHKAAGVPLIVLIDQLEVFMTDVSEPSPTADPSRRESTARASILKKAIEQLARQDAFVIVAGSDVGWNRLPPDVSGRWRRREPVRVGELTEAETGKLLDAYTGPTVIAPFPAKAITRISGLSGGSPREVLRIAFAAYELTAGNLAEADSDAILFQSAQRAGTVADRTKFALSAADSVLVEFGRVLSDVNLGSSTIDRLVLNDGAAVLALKVLSATDKISETYAAQAIASAQSSLASEWPETPLISVAVGYSSAAVHTLLSDSVAIVEFRGTDFPTRLRSVAAQAVAGRGKRPAVPRQAADLTPLLQNMAQQLAHLQAQREQQQAEVQRRFSEPTDSSARERPYGKSRWDLIGYLDELDRARQGQDVERERQLVKAILVANETGRNDRSVDRLGGYYLDLISIATDIESSEAGATRNELKSARGDLARDIRRVVRDVSRLRPIIQDSRVIAAWILTCVVVAAGCLWAIIHERQILLAVSSDPALYPYSLNSYAVNASLRADAALNLVLLTAALALSFAASFVPSTLLMLQRNRDRLGRWEWRVNDLRESAARTSDAPGRYAVLNQVSPAKVLPPYERDRAIPQKVLEGADPDVATNLNNVAELYRAQGRYAEAQPLYERALALREKALGPNHPTVATSLNNLAVYHDAEGRYAEAQPLYERALAIREKALGPDHPDVATTLHNLARLYRDQGRYAEAQPRYKRALAIREKSLGPDHPDVATTLNNLAELYRDQGRYAEAQPLHERALAIQQHALEPDHPAVGTALHNLAGLYRAERRYAEAQPLYERALTISENALGPDHPNVAATLNNLAALYRDQGRLEEAQPLYERALAIHEKALGPEHPNVGTTLQNLARLYYEQGRYAKAQPLYERALAVAENALGTDHPNVATILTGLAGLYYAQGRYADAQPLDERAMTIYEKALGPDDPNVAMSLHNLAEVYYAQGHYTEAQPRYERALAIAENALGPNHPNVTKIVTGLAALYKAEGRYAEAQPLYERALALSENTLDAPTPKR